MPRLVWAVNLLVVGTCWCSSSRTRTLHLIRPTAELVEEDEVLALVYPFTTATWLVYGYASVLFGVTTWILLRHARASRARLSLAGGGGRDRARSGPRSSGRFTMLGLVPGPLRDISPLTFAAGNVVIA